MPKRCGALLSSVASMLTLLLAMLVMAACSQIRSEHGDVAKSGPSSATKAASLRTTLNGLFREHAFLAAAATAAALDDRKADFAAAAEALDLNSVDLSKAIGAIYGKDAERGFLPLWRRHIGFFVDYTVGHAAGNAQKQAKARDDLMRYGEHLGGFLNSANPNLPVGAVAELVQTHVVGLMDVIDAQAAKNPPLAYERLRTAASHMQMIADPIAEAIVTQFADRFAD
jgi:hypothetical protein